MAATFAVNLLGDRNLASTIVFALSNTGEAILIAWLCEHRFGSDFRVDNVRSILGFFIAAGVGPAVSGIGGATGFVLFHTSGTPFLVTWGNWLASDAIGVITVAPLVIGLARTRNDRLTKWEVAEALLGLAALALASAIGFGSPTHHWFTILPITLLLPLLFWFTARCRPVFAAAAAFILALAIVWTITFGIGRLGDAGVPLVDRVHAAQAALLAMSTYTLVLAAVFAERRRSEAVLKNSNDRLQLALNSAELGVWSYHFKTGRFENDARDGRIHGHPPGALPETLEEARSYIHPADLPSLDTAFAAATQTGRRCRTEYRLSPRTDPCDQERWVAQEGTVVRGADGQPLQLLGVTRDITERKHAEARLRESERASRELLGALPAAIFVTDAAGRITYCNEGAIDLWGAKPKLGVDRWFDFSRYCHVDGTPIAREDSPIEAALSQGRVVRGLEAMVEREDGTRIPVIPYPTPLRDETGAVVGMVNMMVDISERKNAELVLAERDAQLKLAERAALVGSYAYDINSDRMQVSEGYAAIHGLPEGTTETTRSQWRGRVLREDFEQVERFRCQSFDDRTGDRCVEYRITRSGGEFRWVESRSFIINDGNGHAQRVVGVNIDVTERKRVEEHQRVLMAELDHRVKNALATVSAVVSRTLDASGQQDAVAALIGRVQSMANTHELLSSSRWQGISLAELLRRELAPYASNGNIEINGPETILCATAGQAMAMVLHELITNAVKHGALSIREGRVRVSWGRPRNSRAHLVLEWQEIDGPVVMTSSAPGYGTSIVRELIPYELGGSVDFVLAREGVRCRMEIPGERLEPGPSQH
jgi:PAS domain S-box-containing protein